MKQYGVMLIGCGHIGMEHLMSICYHEDVRLEAVIDNDAERAAMAARRSGALAWGTDYRPFLEKPEIDVVIIATYTDSHLPILKECLAYHKHVLCEKPLAGTLEKGKEFVDTVKNAGEKVLIAHILRHNRSYQKIRELIEGGAIGELRLIRICQNHHALDWERYRRLLQDCSPTVDCGVHYYDLVQWITGSVVTQVTGFGTKTQEDAPRDNYNLVSFRMANGVSGIYEAGWGKSIRFDNTKEFIGTRGRISLELQATRGADQEEGDRITVYHSDTGVYETCNLHSLYKNMYGQLSTLFRMIEGTSVGNPTIDDVWKAFRVAQLAQESVETGKTIDIDWE